MSYTKSGLLCPAAARNTFQAHTPPRSAHQPAARGRPNPTTSRFPVQVLRAQRDGDGASGRGQPRKGRLVGGPNHEAQVAGSVTVYSRGSLASFTGVWRSERTCSARPHPPWGRTLREGPDPVKLVRQGAQRFVLGAASLAILGARCSRRGRQDRAGGGLIGSAPVSSRRGVTAARSRCVSIASAALETPLSTPPSSTQIPRSTVPIGTSEVPPAWVCALPTATLSLCLQEQGDWVSAARTSASTVDAVCVLLSRSSISSVWHVVCLCRSSTRHCGAISTQGPPMSMKQHGVSRTTEDILCA